MTNKFVLMDTNYSITLIFYVYYLITFIKLLYLLFLVNSFYYFEEWN